MCVKLFFCLRHDLDIPLVVIGDGGKYKQQVKDFILQHDLENKIIFLSERKEAKTDPGFLSTPLTWQSFTSWPLL